MSSGDVNQDVYTAASVVADYVSASDLQPPERVILEQLGAQLAGATMLDLGVGGGRTTAHFAPVVRSYLGLDFSEAMVAACRRRFPDLAFTVGDVRDLSALEDDSFDFVLFSFNGLDDVPPEERARALAEIQRVGKAGGQLCFSAHNLQSLDRWRLGLKRQLCWNPGRLGRNLHKWLRLRLVHNRHLYGKKLDLTSAALVYDHNHGRFMPTYYIRPAHQLAQLAERFADVRVFALDGVELDTPEALDRATDLWLYYLCTIR